MNHIECHCTGQFRFISKFRC